MERPSWSRLLAGFVARTEEPTQEQVFGQGLQSMADPQWSSPFLKDCTPWKGPTLKPFLKNCRLWEGPLLEPFMKDYMLWRDTRLKQGNSTREKERQR